VKESIPPESANPGGQAYLMNIVPGLGDHSILLLAEVILLVHTATFQRAQSSNSLDVQSANYKSTILPLVQDCYLSYEKV
jgi:hypothetical protein